MGAPQRKFEPEKLAVGPLGAWMPRRAEILSITPEQAKSILDHCNTKNRTFKKPIIAKVSSALRMGLWKLNGETIIFSRDGQLLDGQNRLSGCVQAGISLDTWVVFGEPPDSFDTIDRGISRGLADDFSIIGEKNYALLAAAVRMVHAYLGGTRTLSILSNQLESSVFIEFLETHQSIRHSVDLCKGLKNSVPVSGRIISACHYLFGLKSPSDRDEFFDKLSSGAGLEAGDPILALRQRLFVDRIENPRNLKANAHDSAFSVMWLIIRAWNMYRRGHKAVKIIVTTTDFGNRKVISNLPEIE